MGSALRAAGSPAGEQRFTRVDPNGNRASSWTPGDPALAIRLEHGEEVVRRTDGAALGRAGFRMAPRYAVLEKDYAPFSPFGDGGMPVYTGRFHVCAGRCAGGKTYQLSLQPPAGAHAIVRGQVVESVRSDDATHAVRPLAGQRG